MPFAWRIAVLLLALCGWAGRVEACTCVPLGHSSQSLDRASALFAGFVIEERDGVARIALRERWRGALGDSVVVWAPLTPCGQVQLRSGQGVTVSTGPAGPDGRYEVHVCGVTGYPIGDRRLRDALQRLARRPN